MLVDVFPVYIAQRPVTIDLKPKVGVDPHAPTVRNSAKPRKMLD